MEGKEYGKMSVKGYKLPVIRCISSRDLMYSMVTIAHPKEGNLKYLS